MPELSHHAGAAALIGRPNVGKSTLLNRLVGYRVAATADKPQTTRHRIQGIVSSEDHQIVFVDTPGLHRRTGSTLNRVLNLAARAALEEVDVVVMLVEAGEWREGDDYVLEVLQGVPTPVLLAVNKVDRIADKSALLAYIDSVRTRREFAEIIPISAQRGTNLDRLEAQIVARLPLGPPVYPEDQITDRPMRFIVAELIREQAMRLLRQEVPYAVAVEIEAYEEQPEIVRIGAILWVERDAQKAIVIGKGGSMLKRIGMRARESLESVLETKVFLKLWVKVSDNWQDDERKLARLGIDLH
ncbi:MAG: GTPase Era [Chromatiales bacterium]|jgi:GTP-binding protein Era